MPITQILLTATAAQGGGGGGGGGGGNTYNSWTVEWFNKGITPQLVGAPRIFAVASYPAESIAFSSEGFDYAWVGGAPGISTGVSSTDGAWQHWAMVSNGSYLGVFRNGQRLVYSARERMVSDSTNSLYVGISSSPTTGYRGYITNFRIVKGQAMYDPGLSNITVPVVPLTSNANTELLLNAMDTNTTAVDSSGRARSPWGQGGFSWSSQTPFTPASPVSVSPYASFQNTIIYVDSTTYPDIANVQSGWTFSSANYSGTVVGVVSGPTYSIIVNVTAGALDSGNVTFTQPALGGSIEMFSNSVNYGYLGYDAGLQWALDVV